MSTAATSAARKVIGLEENGWCPGLKCGVPRARNGNALGGDDMSRFPSMNQKDVLRTADRAEQRREGQALAAALRRVRQARRIGGEMRVGVRLCATSRD